MEWISVQDKLPKDNQRVVGAVKTLDQWACGLLIYNGNVFVSLDQEPFMYEVSHWIPIPEPPE